MKRFLAYAAVLSVLSMVAIVAAPSSASVPDGAVSFPAGFEHPIYVGGVDVYEPATSTTLPVATSTTEVATSTTFPDVPSTSVAPSSTIAVTSTSTESTVAATSTTAPSATTTSVAPTTTTSTPSAGACGLPQPAFCETFDQPAANAAGKTGDLDSVIWGASRVGDENPSQKLNDVPYIRMDGPCGDSGFHPIATGPNAKNSDIKICSGRMYETVNDGGSVVHLNTYPKQPFDFTGRTGKVAFDVSSDSQGSHAAWPEFVITDRPVPGMRTDISGVYPPTPRHEVGFALDGSCDGQTGTTTTVGTVFVSRNYAYADVPFTIDGCVQRGTLTNLNHIEVRVSTTALEVWGTDPGSTILVKLAHADNLALTFSKGLVWLNDVHYNARKAIEPCQCGTQWNHTFAWDNLGFDGPKTYRDLGYNVPDANTPGAQSTHGADGADPGTMTHTAYQVNTTASFTVNIPTPPQTPMKVLVVFNYWSQAPGVPSIKVNNNPMIATPAPPEFGGGFQKQTIDVEIPLAQVVLGGSNTLVFSVTNGGTDVSNVSIILVAGAPVP